LPQETIWSKVLDALAAVIVAVSATAPETATVPEPLTSKRPAAR
jgi:hypothetical protein